MASSRPITDRIHVPFQKPAQGQDLLVLDDLTLPPIDRVHLEEICTHDQALREELSGDRLGLIRQTDGWREAASALIDDIALDLP